MVVCACVCVCARVCVCVCACTRMCVCVHVQVMDISINCPYLIQREWISAARRVCICPNRDISEALCYCHLWARSFPRDTLSTSATPRQVASNGNTTRSHWLEQSRTDPTQHRWPYNSVQSNSQVNGTEETKSIFLTTWSHSSSLELPTGFSYWYDRKLVQWRNWWKTASCWLY